MGWFVTQKGRGYGKVDAASHGTAWPMNAPQFWDVRKRFMERYGVTYEGVDSPAPADPAAVQAQGAANLGIDLAESTNIAGFGHDFDGLPGTGWYERSSNPFGALLPTEITEFTDSGLPGRAGRQPSTPVAR